MKLLHRQDEGNFEQVEHEPGHWMPGMVEYSGEPNKYLPNNPVSHSFMESSRHCTKRLRSRIRGRDLRLRRTLIWNRCCGRSPPAAIRECEWATIGGDAGFWPLPLLPRPSASATILSVRNRFGGPRPVEVRRARCEPPERRQIPLQLQRRPFSQSPSALAYGEDAWQTGLEEFVRCRVIAFTILAC